MSVDTTPEQRDQAAGATTEKETPKAAVPGLGLSFRNIRWGETLLIALVMALGWCALFLGSGLLQIFAGIIPVMAGLYLGRRVKADWLGHGLVLGFAGFLFGMATIVIYGLLAQQGIVPMPMSQPTPDTPAEPLTFSRLIVEFGLLMAFSLIPFPAFGTVMAGRTEQRNQQLQQEVATRGGRLERPGVVRTLEDLRGLSLPQLGGFVRNLYTKKGFEIKDYRFVDKDKHLDLDMLYEGESYLLRLTVADKVAAGTLQSLVQDMKRRGIGKGVVIASTEFTPDALKTGRDRKNLVLIDGPTLFEISES
jgi:hypothetical protein